MFRLFRAFGRVFFGLVPLLGFVATLGWMLWRSNDGVAAAAQPAFIAACSLNLGFLLLQGIAWMRYRSFDPAPREKLPTLSVIIPAYNEGPMIERSIRSVLAADYPRELLDIIVVDDGSRDDTYFHIERLRSEHPDVVRVIRFRGNQGKRAGLFHGFTAARGELVITLDSDSEIEPQTLQMMVAPLVLDPQVGAVAGRVQVLNRKTLLGRMLEVQYALAFDFARASQSAYRSVACCPGALSAFRRALILPHLEGWMNQTFLGRPVSHGEDQALTNIVLKQGYDTVYQRFAVVHTIAPQHYRQLFRMFTRWDRSFIVEGFSFGSFMFSGYRKRNRILPALMFVLGNLRLISAYVGLLFLPLVLLRQPLVAFEMLFAAMIASTCSALYYLHTERSMRFLYGTLYTVYAFFLLQWTLPWALLTVRDERWGTR